MNVAVLMPTWNRPEQVYKNAGDLLAQELQPGDSLTLVCSVPVDDMATQRVMLRLHDEPMAEGADLFWLTRKPNQSAVVGWLQAYEHAVRHNADWFVLGADDIEWDARWLFEAKNTINEFEADVIGLNDGQTDLNKYAPHYMMSRKYASWYGFIPDGYQAWWFDREVCEVAQSLGLYAPAWKAKAKHNHPDWNLAEVDGTYEWAQELRDVDKRLYWSERNRVIL